MKRLVVRAFVSLLFMGLVIPRVPVKADQPAPDRFFPPPTAVTAFVSPTSGLIVAHAAEWCVPQQRETPVVISFRPPLAVSAGDSIGLEYQAVLDTPVLTYTVPITTRLSYVVARATISCIPVHAQVTLYRIFAPPLGTLYQLLGRGTLHPD